MIADVIVLRRHLTGCAVDVFMVIATVMGGLDITRRLALIKSLSSRAETSRIPVRHHSEGTEGGRWLNVAKLS